MGRLLFRNLTYYWRTNLAVIAGVATSVAVLAGALLVGQSVRASLRDLLFQRIGATAFVVSADRFFRADLAAAFSSDREVDRSAGSCPIIFVQGTVTAERTGQRAPKVNIVGVDDRFWVFHGVAGVAPIAGRDALVGAALARRIGVGAGDGLLLRIETRQGIPRETLYGRREDVGRTIRLTCREILPADRMGEFALKPTQGDVDTVFVPLSRLQQDLAQPRGANVILVGPSAVARDAASIQRVLRERFALEDIGITLRPLPSQDGVSVESARILLDDQVATAALAAAADEGLSASGLFTYLANTIRAEGREIPYSIVTAADLGKGAFRDVAPSLTRVEQPIQGDDRRPIWLTDWSARDLGVTPGAAVEIDYYRWQEEGVLVTRTARFRLAGIVPGGRDVDATLAPDVPGITEAGSIREWDPPFPIDLHRIRPRDEDYWNRFKAAPKAFIELSTGQDLWQSRFGRYSAVRIVRPGSGHGERAGAPVERRRLDDVIGGQLRARLDPERAGFAVSAVRQSGIEAASGSTDFGEYFLYFSAFLIAAAVLLSALFFRLGVEQRVREVGTLQALGFPVAEVRRIFLLEGAVLSAAGSIAGMIGAVAFGDVLIYGLRTWWIGAVGTRQLHLHASWGPLLVGAAAGGVVSLLVIVWTLRGLQRNSTRASLAGVLESSAVQRGRARAFRILLVVALLAAIGLLFASLSRTVTEEEGFFGTGLFLLVAMLSLAGMSLRRQRPHPLRSTGLGAMVRFGIRNAVYRPGRSLASITLVASATFVIVSVEAFRRDPQLSDTRPESGTGGFSLIASSVLPIVHDPNTAQGREALGIPPSEVPELARVRFVPFRERSGEDASCLNLYAPQDPTILGASHAFVASGRFGFRSSLAATSEQKANPWLLIESRQPDGCGRRHRRREYHPVHPSPFARRRAEREGGQRRADSPPAGCGTAGERAAGAADHVRGEFPASLPGPGGLPFLPDRCPALGCRVAGRAASGTARRLGSERRALARPAGGVHPRRKHVSVDVPVARGPRPLPRHPRALGRFAPQCAGAAEGTGAAPCGGVS